MAGMPILGNAVGAGELPEDHKATKTSVVILPCYKKEPKIEIEDEFFKENSSRRIRKSSVKPSAFLIPYMLMLVFGAVPLFYMELILGQYNRQGVGFCAVMVAFYVSFYYNVIIGKVVWLTATMPYVVLSILLVRGLLLPGATRGIAYYLKPELSRLKDTQVWVDAAVQIFYSVGAGFGVHLSYASYNTFHNNCYRDCLITTLVNCFTSFFSGFVIFTYLGFMSHKQGVPISSVATEGLKRFSDDVEEMLGFRPGLYWRICWKFISPTFIIGVVVFGLLYQQPLQYQHYTYPHWAEVLGWGLACSSILMIPIVAVYKGWLAAYLRNQNMKQSGVVLR
ncbi:unnamed protein product [Leptidea sinapis]|uniref:Uncharacterized protein n=1 Tax=Leptidea sinapis TaxID=189913 RepID=A0A5E4PN34_9NEOP|nr:unnamed protein product [Leptidea sinapis]